VKFATYYNSTIMKVLILLGLVSYALAKDTFIVNGQAASAGEYPWQGGWLSFGSFSCGCVVVHQNWILTAGHCVGGAVTQYTAEVGNINRGSGQQLSVSSIVRHPDYNVGSGFTPNDVAVVGAAVPIDGVNIAPAPGGLDTGIDRTSHECWISGWGRTCGGCALPVALQEANVPVIDDATCTSMWTTNYNPALHICVYNGQSGSCNGDSGGPLVCRSDASDTYDLIGLTSWGATGCPVTYPSVYARLSAFLAFVCTETNNEVCY